MLRSGWVVGVAIVALCARPAGAEDGPDVRSNVVSLDPVSGLIGFTGHNAGEFALSWERRLGGGPHAILVEQTTVHVHDAPTHVTTFGLGLGYRRHFGAGDAPFAGVVAGGKLGTGRFDGPGGSTKVHATALGVSLHGGYRWVWRSGVTLTARLGAGYARYRVDADSTAAEDAAAGRLAAWPVELDSELSLGWSF